jgi:hypothetical protein
MPLANKTRLELDSKSVEVAPSLRVLARTFQIPLARDAMVIGRWAPVSREIMRDALKALALDTFAGIDIRDDKIRSILVRESVLRKIDWDLIQKIVQRDIKPLMEKSEILALKFEIEVVLGENFFGRPV